jgi:hypothetical protein
MKALIFSLLLISMANAANTWYNWKTTIAGTPNWLVITPSYKFPLWYGTTYHSGEGPYYSKNLFTSMTKADHYEEYGFLVNNTFAAAINFDIGTTGSEVYSYKLGINIDLLTLNPYRQVVYWSRPYGEYLANGAASQSTFVGGASQIDVGHAYLRYCETMTVGSTNLWSALDGTTAAYWNE